MYFLRALFLLVALTAPTLAFASNGVDGDKVYNILIPYFVLAVVFEIALAPLFNWRIFLLHFEGKGYKTPIAVVLAYFTFSAANLDIFGELLAALGHGYSPIIDSKNVPHPVTSTWWGEFLTAFLIAGGSSGINQIFAKLGIRTPELNKQKAEDTRKAKKLAKPE